jgi:hypothetical protein
MRRRWSGKRLVTYFIQADVDAGIGDGNFLFRTHRELFAQLDPPVPPTATDRYDGDCRNQNTLNALRVHELPC